ncbi:hypothetical protein MKEN_00968700 [Mycena kentingensis (nom. inval.)]|nr:hypothetical protein MKEN_00968700 [Mycena kentingensis (nom. inval.)]
MHAPDSQGHASAPASVAHTPAIPSPHQFAYTSTPEVYYSPYPGYSRYPFAYDYHELYSRRVRGIMQSGSPQAMLAASPAPPSPSSTTPASLVSESGASMEPHVDMRAGTSPPTSSQNASTSTSEPGAFASRRAPLPTRAAMSLNIGVPTDASRRDIIHGGGVPPPVPSQIESISEQTCSPALSPLMPSASSSTPEPFSFAEMDVSRQLHDDVDTRTNVSTPPAPSESEIASTSGSTSTSGATSILPTSSSTPAPFDPFDMGPDLEAFLRLASLNASPGTTSVEEQQPASQMPQGPGLKLDPSLFETMDVSVYESFFGYDWPGSDGGSGRSR